VVKYNASPLVNKFFTLNRCYEIIIFIILVFKYMAITSEWFIGLWGKTCCLPTYEFGLIPRAFFGSVVAFFTDHITTHLIYVVHIVAYLVLITLISLLLGGAIRRSHPSIRPAIIVFSMLFLASPYSVTYLSAGYTGRLDIFWIIITLMALVFLKNRVLMWLIPLLCIIAILIHEGFMTTYMPALAIPLLYEAYKKKYSKKNIAVFSLSCLFMVITFSVVQFFSAKLPFNNAVDYAEYLSRNTDFNAAASQLYVEYFAPFKEYLLYFIFPTLKIFAVPLGITLLVISAPLLIIFWYIWKNSFKGADNKFLKFIFLLCAGAPLIFIPAALFGTDWDRWWAAVINNQFILIFYFIYSNERTVINFVKKTGEFFNKHFLLFVLIIVFTNSLTFTELVANMYSVNSHILRIIAGIYEDYFNKYLYYLDKKSFSFLVGL